MKSFQLFPKAAKTDQQVILVVASLFLILISLIGIVRLGQVGSPGAEEVLSIVEELTDLTPPLVVGLTELDDTAQRIDVFYGEKRVRSLLLSDRPTSHCLLCSSASSPCS